MENPAVRNDYGEAKRRAKEGYREIGRVWCAKLGDHISFTRVGFQHLVRKGRRPRSRQNQIRRFFLLSFIRSVLADPAAQVAYEEKTCTDRLPCAKFWAITGKQNNKKITVIIRQIEAGKKHFFSIYDQKITLQRE
jgi:hypothetical protein